MSRATGLDLADHQGLVDWDKVKPTKDFAIVRASYGLTIDDRFIRNWGEMDRVGILRGAYQFLRPSQSAVAQANYLCDLIGPYVTGDIPPVLDVERDGTLLPTYAPASEIRAWINVVKTRMKITPIIYTGISVWNTGYTLQTFDCPLWISNPNPNAVKPNPTLAWGENWKLWQYNWKGRVAGITGAGGQAIDVDLDVYNGTLDEMKAWIASLNLAPETPPVVLPEWIMDARNEASAMRGDISKLAARATNLERLLNTE